MVPAPITPIVWISSSVGNVTGVKIFDRGDPRCRVGAMRLWMAFLAVLPACSGFMGPPLTMMGDGGTDSDGTVVPPDGRACFGTLVPVCFSVLPTAPLTLPMDNVVIDTGTSPMCDQNNDRTAGFCVLAGTSFTLTAAQSIRGVGAKPLVVLSTTTIDLQGSIDVSSTKAATDNLGANANSLMCTDGTAAMGVSGSFGGSFGGPGGNGDMIATDLAGIAALVTMTDLPTTLRGGCAGGPAAGTLGGAGGAGGGAVAIVAGTSINVTGKVNASGSGGHGGGEAKCGGGGGGSGGMIVLDAPTITGAGLVYANGGGGGQGGTSGAGHGGDDGHDSTGPTDSNTGGKNTTGGREGGPGGDGSSGSVLKGGTAPDQAGPNGGGGGGGGGAGFVHAPGLTSIAPPSK
jgi:hypothetical protein